MTDNECVLARVKRRWVPELLWHWAVHPIPFWNDIFPEFRFSLTFLTNLLSTDDRKELERAQEGGLP